LAAASSRRSIWSVAAVRSASLRGFAPFNLFFSKLRSEAKRHRRSRSASPSGKSKAKRYSARPGRSTLRAGVRSREPMQMPRVVSIEKICLSGKLMVFRAAALPARCTRRRRAGHAFVGNRRVGREWRRRSGHARSGPDQGSVASAALWVAIIIRAAMRIIGVRGISRVNSTWIIDDCVRLGSSTPAR
jgi:hypothetical protein